MIYNSEQFHLNSSLMQEEKKMHRMLFNHKSASSPKGTPHRQVRGGGGDQDFRSKDKQSNKDVQHLEDRNTGSKPVENEHSGSCG